LAFLNHQQSSFSKKTDNFNLNLAKPQILEFPCTSPRKSYLPNQFFGVIEGEGFQVQVGGIQLGVKLNFSWMILWV